MNEMTNFSQSIKFDINQNIHFSNLRDSYQAVGGHTWLDHDFLKHNLEKSRSLFVPESLRARKPQPEALEVYALLSGLPFAKNFIDELIVVQRQISEIIGNNMHYWVEPENLGVEYCVFKWPTDSWHQTQCEVTKEVLAQMKPSAFKFHIGGVQINPDGCVVARGYDEGAQIHRMRTLLKAKIPSLPEKQSGWAHVPLGRILEPLGKKQFIRLGHLINEISDVLLVTTEINAMKLIRETRWYMTERETLAEYSFINSY